MAAGDTATRSISTTTDVTIAAAITFRVFTALVLPTRNDMPIIPIDVSIRLLPSLPLLFVSRHCVCYVTHWPCKDAAVRLCHQTSYASIRIVAAKFCLVLPRHMRSCAQFAQFYQVLSSSYAVRAQF